MDGPWIYYNVNTSTLAATAAPTDFVFTTGSSVANITWQSPMTDPVRTVDEGDYKPAPRDWHSQMMRRRRGQKLLLSMMDVYDRLEWYEHKCVRLQYPLRSECHSDYGGRSLFLTPKGNYEFYRGIIKSRRNIWLSTSGQSDTWSLEDRYLALIFAFQTDFFGFVQVGCRDCMYQGEEQQIEDLYAYGYKMRLRAIATAKKNYDHLAGPTIERRRIDAIQ